ncbi:MAG: hypothetical protein HYS40_07080 [Gemmatimonadetes bacterium]|nr:hypothetical protein [Gemmatimonadota bacterium]
MNDTPTRFDHRPDPVLGAALRHALEPGDQAAFVARVVAGFDVARTAAAPTWEVLAGWAGRGIAAATVAALLAGLLLARSPRASVGVEEAFASTAEGGATTALLTGLRPPDASVVFATLVER